MDHYKGLVSDTPVGGGAWVNQHGFGHEAFNFAPIRREYFGYVQPPGPSSSPYRRINLRRLGAATGTAFIDGVAVAWVATHPTDGGTRIVGWYLNATVYAEFQSSVPVKGRVLPDGAVPRFLVRAKEARLLDRDERTFRLPRGRGGMGQSNVWYPGEAAARSILKYISSGKDTSFKPGALPRLQDVQRRLQIEKSAMEAASSWFVSRGYTVKDVSLDHAGWDLEARRYRTQLKVEVKGTSLGAHRFLVELTPNEFEKMSSKELRASYRLCVVTDCEREPVVAVFAWSEDSRSWTTGDGTRQLVIVTRTGARVSSKAR